MFKKQFSLVTEGAGGEWSRKLSHIEKNIISGKRNSYKLTREAVVLITEPCGERIANYSFAFY